MPVEWSAIITAVVIGIVAYLWRQAQRVDAIYQALFGIEGRNGIARRVEALERDADTVDKRIMESRHLVRNELLDRFDDAVRKASGT